MIRIRSNFILYIIIYCFIFAFPLFSYAQNTTDKIIVASAEITKQTVKIENQKANADNEDEDDNEENNYIQIR